MPVQNPIADRIQLLRARVERYKQLVQVLYDRRIAAEVAGIAEELEAEVVRMERYQSSQSSHWKRNAARPALFP